MVYLLVVVVIILYLCYLFSWWRTQTAFPTNCTVIDILDSNQVKAGDLIFTTNRRKQWRYSWWQHVAIVFEDKDGRKQVADLLRNGLHIVPIELYVRMDTHDTVYGIKSLRTHLTEKQKTLLEQAVYSHMTTKFNQHYVAIYILRRILPAFMMDLWIKGEHCSSFIANCLIKIALLPPCDRHAINVMDLANKILCNYYDSGPMKLYLSNK